MEVLHTLKIVGIAVLVFLSILFIIPLGAISSFLPATPAELPKEYEEVGRLNEMDWTEFIVYDTVRYDNDFKKATPWQTPFSFLRVDYRLYEAATKKVKDNKTGEIKEKDYWKQVKSMHGSSYSSIKRILDDIGYNTKKSNMTIPQVVGFFEDLEEENEEVTYEDGTKIEIEYDVLTIEDLIDFMDNDHQLWAAQLLSTIHNLYGGVSDNEDYYLPDGVVAFMCPSPTSRNITSPFGYRVHPVTKVTAFHYGIDLSKSGGSYGEPVVSVADGVVVEVNYSNGIAGWNIRIKHQVEGAEWQSRYLHLSEIRVEKGDEVVQGQTIGAIGDTGRVDGPHLHFELKYKGGLVDPARYVMN